jgi:redox-sensitive bicupin YhaK (pirin superfamily)
VVEGDFLYADSLGNNGHLQPGGIGNMGRRRRRSA